MCCFSRPVVSVTDTKIFARLSKRGRQLLAYSMSLEAKESLAMVLPIPVAKGAGEDAVRFINLEKYPNLFADLEKGFPVPPPSALRFGCSRTIQADKAPLVVYQVGSFEASFVPSQNDFSRLDERFRLPEGAFKQLPQYQDWGFAVFKLKPGKQTVHPMAFEFPTALATRLFFPTVHIHDGQVHAKEHFSHALYCQPTTALPLKLTRWDESEKLVKQFVKTANAQDLVAPAAHVYRLKLYGELPNQDTFVEAQD